MPTFPTFSARPLDEAGRSEAQQLAAGAAAHGIYVANALLAHEGEVLVCQGAAGLLGCMWFGPRGNLVVIEREPLDPTLVADAVQRSRWPWRIALGPAASIDALARRLTGRPLVLRDQVYHGCRPRDARPAPGAPAVRLATPKDRERLMRATLELNRHDLKVDPRRVDRRWLREIVDSRIREGSTLVIGAEGALVCKLDLGSRGPYGAVVEGVFTFPEARNQGLARALVAAVAATAAVPFVCLHVDVDNQPARRAYTAAGLVELERCRLVLSS